MDVCVSEALRLLLCVSSGKLLRMLLRLRQQCLQFLQTLNQ